MKLFRRVTWRRLPPSLSCQRLPTLFWVPTQPLNSDPAGHDLQQPQKRTQEGISAGDETGEVKRTQWGQARNDALRPDCLHPTTKPGVGTIRPHRDVAIMRWCGDSQSVISTTRVNVKDVRWDIGDTASAEQQQHI